MESNLTANLKLRDPSQEDLEFIYATWLRSLYYNNEWFNLIDKDIFFDKYKLVLHALLSRGVEVRIAGFDLDEYTILGYSVYEGDTLHWVYVKKAWREMGVAKLLVKPTTNKITHLTKLGKKLKRPEWSFDPFL